MMGQLPQKPQVSMRYLLQKVSRDQLAKPPVIIEIFIAERMRRIDEPFATSVGTLL